MAEQTDSLYFADYAEFICEHFSDRVVNIATINEPQIISGLGYMNGLHAPGKKLDCISVLSVIHHLALAHGLVAKMRAVAKQPIKTGFQALATCVFLQVNVMKILMLQELKVSRLLPET